MIVLSGGTAVDVQKHGYMEFGASPLSRFGGFVGYEWWGRHSWLSATVWDLKDASSAGEVVGSVSGTASLTGAILLPIYASPQTESTLCRDLGEKLVTFLRGSNSQGREASKPSPVFAPAK